MSKVGKSRPAKKPKTGGRKAGTPNKKTLYQVKAVEDTGLTPLQFLTSVYRAELPPELAAAVAEKPLDPTILGALTGWYDRRIDAAGKAAPYVHAKLVSVHETLGKKKSFAQWLVDQNSANA